MARKRNYRAEYARRIARGKAKGLSVSVSRGHPKTKIKTIVGRKGKRKETRRIEIGIKQAKRANEYLLGRKIRPHIAAGMTDAEVRAFVLRDRDYTFNGDAAQVVRQRGDGSGPEYQLRLEQLASRAGAFDWKNEGKFIKEMMGLFNKTEREAYSLWFSPGGTGG